MTGLTTNLLCGQGHIVWNVLILCEVVRAYDNSFIILSVSMGNYHWRKFYQLIIIILIVYCSFVNAIRVTHYS